MNNPKMQWRKTVSFTIASKSAKLKLWKLQNIIGIKGLMERYKGLNGKIPHVHGSEYLIELR